MGRAAALLRREADAFFAKLTALAGDQGYPFRLRRPEMVRFQGLREALELAGAAAPSRAWQMRGAGQAAGYLPLSLTINAWMKPTRISAARR